MTATIKQTDRVSEVSETAAVPPDIPVRRVAYRSGPLPWRRRDMVICGLLGLIGVAGVVGCWFGATEEIVWREQSGWLIGAIFSTGLVGGAGVSWVLIGLRRVRQGFRDLRRDQRAALGLNRVRGRDDSGGRPDLSGTIDTSDLVSTGQMMRLHRPGCLLLRGKQAVLVPVDEVDNYRRCGVCNS